jgi:ATP-dependent helicase/nuclease subunit A
MSAAELRKLDEQARRLARGDFDRPIVLEAGAGTGKTAALVARVAVWSLTGGWDRARATLGAGAAPARVAERALERVAMITFTDKAAVEMERRIDDALRRIARGEAVKGLPIEETGLSAAVARERATHLGAALDRLQVQTIHGFCSALLARHALAAGLHPASAVDADGSALRRICSEVVSEALPDALGATPDPEWLALLAAGKGPNDVSAALELLVEESVGPADLRRDPYAPAQVERFIERVHPLASELASILGQRLPRVPRKHLEKICAVRDAIESLARALAERPAVEQLRAALHIGEDELARLCKLAADDPSDTERKELREGFGAVRALSAELEPILAAAGALDVDLMRAARAVLAPLLEEVERRRRALGVLGFQDLLCKARDLLRDDPDVRRSVRDGLDQLLVDEFQDTDDVQCEIVRRIALDGARGERPGLFLVGDPKQSIYGWRRADLRAYEALCGAVERAGGARAQLYVNYRSSQVVLEEVRRLVEPAMQYEPGVQPRFEPLLEGRSMVPAERELALREGRGAIEHWCSRGYARAETARIGKEGSKTPAGTARELEAQAIARDLAALRAAGVDLGRCAILLRTLTEQDVYLSALREHAIPYAVGKDREFYRTREVTEASALAAAILDPGDVLALLTLLRSPLGGVPDAALAPLWRAGLPELCARLDGRNDDALARAEAAIEKAAAEAREALRELPDAGLERVERWPLVARSCLRALHGLRRAFGEEPADRAVERLRAWLVPELVEAARFPGPYRLANLERFLRELVAALAANGSGPHDVLRALRTGLSGDVEKESAPPGDAALGAVQILSIHGAKGLEFASVWLADLHHERKARNEAKAVRVDRLDGELELELFGAAGLRSAEAAVRREARERAEQVRLLYVAATRAEDRLVLAGMPGRAEGKRCELSHLVARRAGMDAPWTELEAAWREGGATSVERDGALWRLIGAEPKRTVEGDGADGERSRSALSESRMRAVAREAQAARARAAAHAARPWIQAASADPHAEEREARERGEGSGLSRSAARAVGVAVHAALERWDPSLAPGKAQRVALEHLEPFLAARLAGRELRAALERARDLVNGCAASELGKRLGSLGPKLIARELPLALAAAEGDLPTGAFVGAADLVYEDGRGLVVADFKTDVEDDEGALAVRYAPQLERYARALETALGRSVRCELWLVAAGRVAELARA